jgi:uncharacterized protein
MLFRFLIFICLLLFVEIYSYQAFKTVIKTKLVLQIYVVTSVLIIIYVTYYISKFDPKIGQTPQSLFTLGLLLIVLIPKLLITIFMEKIFLEYFLEGLIILLKMITELIFYHQEENLLAK